MKTFFFILVFALIPSLSFSVEKFYVNQDEAVSDDEGKVKLAYTLTNGEKIAVSYFDISVYQSLELEKVELTEGWAESGKTTRNVRVSTGNKLQPGGSGQIKLTMRIKDAGEPNIFQMRRPSPAFTLTVYYATGEKKAWSIYPPFIPNMR